MKYFDPTGGRRWLPGEKQAAMCLTKLKYESATSAGKAKEAMRRRRNGPADKRLDVYRCPFCSGWHLGRPQKKKRLKGQRED